MSARGGAAVKTEICHCCARGKPETTLEKAKVERLNVKKVKVKTEIRHCCARGKPETTLETAKVKKII